jgi:hypothetical protein
LKLQEKGLKTPGLFKWLKANLGITTTNARKARQELNDIIGDAGGPEDDDTNYHVLVEATLFPGKFIDRGIYDSMEVVETLYRHVGEARPGSLVVMRTLDAPRDMNPNIVMEYA